MKTVIFGCGIIAKRIAKGFDYVKDNELVGFASKDIDKAKSYAEEFNVPMYGDYDFFLNNNDIDAIYVATYNLDHYELVKKCLQHHKHVICEKPMFSSIEENDELFLLAKQNNCLLMEAMKAVFLPLNIKIKQMINDGIIGEVQSIEASFIRGPKIPETHWIYDLKTGGALKDIGTYCAALILFLTDKSPKLLYRNSNATDKLSDTTAEVLLDCDGIKGHILVSNEIFGESSLNIYGTKGYIRVPEFWKTGKGYYVINNQKYELDEEMKNDFYYELQHFTDLLNNGMLQSPIMSQEFSNNLLKICKK